MGVDNGLCQNNILFSPLQNIRVIHHNFPKKKGRDFGRSKVICQVSGKLGHMTLQCCHQLNNHYNAQTVVPGFIVVF